LSVFPFVADFSLVHACTMVCRDPRERLRERLTFFKVPAGLQRRGTLHVYCAQ
jgi:hypothetical protein